MLDCLRANSIKPELRPGMLAHRSQLGSNMFMSNTRHFGKSYTSTEIQGPRDLEDLSSYVQCYIQTRANDQVAVQGQG